jgi:hypothetical protein
MEFERFSPINFGLVHRPPCQKHTLIGSVLQRTRTCFEERSGSRLSEEAP